MDCKIRANMRTLVPVHEHSLPVLTCTDALPLWPILNDTLQEASILAPELQFRLLLQKFHWLVPSVKLECVRPGGANIIEG